MMSDDACTAAVAVAAVDDVVIIIAVATSCRLRVVFTRARHLYIYKRVAVLTA